MQYQYFVALVHRCTRLPLQGCALLSKITLNQYNTASQKDAYTSLFIFLSFPEAPKARNVDIHLVIASCKICNCIITIKYSCCLGLVVLLLFLRACWDPSMLLCAGVLIIQGICILSEYSLHRKPHTGSKMNKNS